jgi:YegS/Rv2252/BmrU family lipid kinase
MKALLIHNPVAGHRECDAELRQTAAQLVERGWDLLDIERTHGHGDATAYARKAVAAGCDVLFVVGGDGTVAQAVDGLVGSQTALAILPGGTGNVLARQLNLPTPGALRLHPILDAAELLLDGQTRRVDVGRVSGTTGGGNPRHFLCWGGVGFDARLNQAVNQDTERKKRLGLLAFLLSGLSTLREFVGTSAIVRVDGARVSRRMLMLVANNIQLYGVFFRMAPRAILDDGFLDICIFQGRHPARALLHLAQIALNRHIQDPRVDIYRAKRVEIRTARTMPVHVDGDYVGDTPIVMEVVPRALSLIVPHCAPASLFVDGSGMMGPETTWEWMVRHAREAQEAILGRSADEPQT